MKICLYTPGLADHEHNPSANLGDLIIQEAVERELNSIFGSPTLYKLPSHRYPKKEQVPNIRACDLSIVGGSNLLDSQMNIHRQWKVSWRQQLLAKKPVLLGAGWRRYQSKPNLFTSVLLKLVLSSKWLHSVRDSYSLKQLQSAGIRNVINTGCPTMWPFIDFNCNALPTQKADTALVMITDYRKDLDADRQLLELLGQSYQKVIAWPQGTGDQEYLTGLTQGAGNWQMLDHSFSDFQTLLKSDVQFDYIGTRLHGGIKCLLSGRRGLIIEIDNRAKEMAKDTQLPTVVRGDLDSVQRWIQGAAPPQIQVDAAQINRWRTQYQAIAQPTAPQASVLSSSLNP